jgi:hypothetical protein
MKTRCPYRVSLLSLLVPLSYLFASPSFAVPVQDQGQIFGTDGEVSITSDTLSQSITTGVAGQLVGIQIQYNGDGAFPAPLLDFSIVAGGNPPVGELLYEEILSLGDVLDGDLITWDLTATDLVFDIGDQFSFVMRTVEDAEFIIAGNDPPGYDGGELYLNGEPLPGDAVNDIAFITYVDPDGGVTPVDEPLTFPLMLMGLLAIGVIRRIRN